MALRIPSPVALTKPEAYLAYKAGILSRGELKDKLLNPINNYEGWLAKWCELLETYPTNEDGTPQCLTDEEGLLAYLCGVTDRYPATNSRPDDARVSAYIRYLVSARYERPDHPLNREEFYLSLIKTQFIPSGDPSSDIVIDGTTKAPFVDVKAYGDTLQNSYSGKNLWNGEFGQGQTYNPTTTNRITTTQSPALLSGQAYTVSAFNLPSGFRYAVALFASPAYPGSNPGTAVFDSGWKTSESFTFTPSSDCYFAVIMSKTDNTSLTPSDVSSASYQLELGSTATSYEPYVGGIPAPNPEFPQPISVVTGENVVKVVGKNLMPILDGSVTLNGITATVADGILTLNGTSTASGYIKLTNGLVGRSGASIDSAWLNENVTNDINGKVISFDCLSGTAPTNSWAFRRFSTSTSHDQQWLAVISDTSTAFPTSGKHSAFSCLAVFINANMTFDNYKVAIQLELGSQATAYQAYTGQDYTISLGELELAKIGTYQDRIYKEGEKWYVEKQTGRVVLTGADSENWKYTNGVCFTDSISDYSRSDNKPLSDNLTTTVNVHGAGGVADNTSAFGSANLGRQKRFYVKYTSLFSSVATIETWLSAHPTTVYYALATPTTTEITNQALIDQLNALKQGGAEEGTTYIKVSATDPNLPAKLYVEAPKYD